MSVLYKHIFFTFICCIRWTYFARSDLIWHIFINSLMCSISSFDILDMIPKYHGVWTSGFRRSARTDFSIISFVLFKLIKRQLFISVNEVFIRRMSIGT